jgi:hypothetical protein
MNSRLAPLAGLAEVAVDRDMRGDRSISQIMHFVGLVRLSVLRRLRSRLSISSSAFPGRLADTGVDRQAITVLDQDMAHLASWAGWPLPRF